MFKKRIFSNIAKLLVFVVVISGVFGGVYVNVKTADAIEEVAPGGPGGGVVPGPGPGVPPGGGVVDPGLGTTSLRVIKNVPAPNSGKLPKDFMIHVFNNAGADVQDGGIPGGPPDSPLEGLVAPGRTYTLPVGIYYVREEAVSNYTVTFSGDCVLVPGTDKAVVNLTAPGKVCIVTNTYTPPAEGTLNIITDITNAYGGTMTYANASITVNTTASPGKKINSIYLSTNSTNPSADIIPVPSLPVTTVTFPGNVSTRVLKVDDDSHVTISKNTISGYSTGNPRIVCDDGTEMGNPTVPITIEGGSTKTCRVYYEDIAPVLKVVTNVINNNGGIKNAGNFTMTVTGTSVSPVSFAGMASPGKTVALNAGAYTVTGTDDSGYTKSFGAGCSVGSTIAVGQTKTCTVTYDDVAPAPVSATLKVITNVTNDNGGTKGSGNFTMTVNGNNPSVTSFTGIAGTVGPPATGGKDVLLDAGGYDVTGSSITGYTVLVGTGCSGTITAGGSKTCVVTYNDVAPNFRVKTVLLNNNGGTKTSEFKINVTGPKVISISPAPNPPPIPALPAVSVVTYAYVGESTLFVNSGTYTVGGEDYVGYTKTSSGSCSPSVSVGQIIIPVCTITYDDVVPLPIVTLSATPTSVTEGGQVTITATLNEAITPNLTVNLGTDPAGTTAGSLDYTWTPTITISSGSLTGTTTLTTLQDTVVESADELVKLKINNVSSPDSVTISPASPTITIEDAPIIPVLSVSPPIVIRGEVALLTATLPDGMTASQDIPITLTTDGSTATGDGDDSDYEMAGSMTILVDKSSKTIPIYTKSKTGEPSEVIHVVGEVGPASQKTNGVSVALLDYGQTECPGEVMGFAPNVSPVPDSQIDHGISNSNTHEGAKSAPGYDNPAPVYANLSILGTMLSVDTYAPARDQAACVTKQFSNSTYGLRGYIWNDNLGFISLFCDGTEGASGNNLGIECGEYSYDVTINKVENGQRKLTGFAWNPAFGYMSFRDPNNESDPMYNVYAVPSESAENVWDLHGYAWTQAGVYLKMDGLAVELLTDKTACTVYTPGYPCCLPDAVDNPACIIEVVECEAYGAGSDARTCCLAVVNGTDPLPEICGDVCVGPGCDECTGPDCGGGCGDDASCWNCAADYELNGEELLSDPTCCALPEYANVDLIGGGKCSDNAHICEPPFFTGGGICISTSPGAMLANADAVGSLPVANCIGGYDFRLYFKNEDGSSRPYDNENINVDFYWTDTVKLDQVSGASIGAANDDIESPFDAGAGGVKYKPIHIIAGAGNFKVPGGLFTEFNDGGEYYYKLNKKVSSCAPTTGGNVSRFETVARALFDNEVFLGLYNLWKIDDHGVDGTGGPDNKVTAKDSVKELNRLKLDHVTYAMYSGGEDGGFLAADTIYPNGGPSYLRFRPAVEVFRLYTDDFKDAITAYRDIPFNVNVVVKKNGLYTGSDPEITLTVDYDSVINANDAKFIDARCKNGNTFKTFNFEIDDPGGYTSAVGGTCSASDEVQCTLEKTYNAVQLVEGAIETLRIKPVLPPSPPGGVVPEPQALCPRVPAPAIYSTVEYNIDGETVKYYSNKLPKLPGSFLDNKAAIIHGTILSTMQFSSDVTQKYSIVGDVVSNIVRDTVHQNVNKYIKGSDSAKAVPTDVIFKEDADMCNVTAGAGGGTISVPCSGNGSTHHAGNISVGSDEYADYFYGVNVVIGAIDGQGGDDNSFKNIGKRIVVVEGGNVLINKNVHDDGDGTDDSQMVIVAMTAKDASGEYGGNVYIADDVTTLSNVAILADGSVHPFFKVESGDDVFNLLGDKGEFNDFDVLADFYRGEHKDDSYQLFIKGAVSAKTVAGISNITKDNKNLLGTNEAVDGDNSVFRSMFFDWNAFRYFKGGDFVSCGSGMIRDLSCGTCLTVGDMINIYNETAEICGAAMEGDYMGCKACTNFVDKCVCDGITAELNSGFGRSGDLVPAPDKESDLARSNKPFYLYYVPVRSAILSVQGE